MSVTIHIELAHEQDAQVVLSCLRTHDLLDATMYEEPVVALNCNELGMLDTHVDFQIQQVLEHAGIRQVEREDPNSLRANLIARMFA